MASSPFRPRTRSGKKLLKWSSLMTFDGIISLLNPLIASPDFVHGLVSIERGRVLYNGEVLNNSLAKRIARMHNEWFSIRAHDRIHGESDVKPLQSGSERAIHLPRNERTTDH